MKKEFTYKIGVYGTLKRNEADLVFLHLKHHPDTKRYTKQGEFGFSFVNYYAGEDVQRDFSIREIDKMLKSLEYPLEIVDGKKIDLNLKNKIINKFFYWAESINSEYLRIKDENK